MSSGAPGPSRKRVRHVIKNPNPLFEQWLREWRDEAAKSGTHAKNTYSKALQSLSKFPLPLSSGRDCIILKNFGQKICDMLDKKLAEHRKLHPNWTPQTVSVPSPASTGGASKDAKTRDTETASARKKQSKISSSSSRNVIPTNDDENHRKIVSGASSTLATKTKSAALASLKINARSRRVPTEVAESEATEPSEDPQGESIRNVKERYQITPNGVTSSASQPPVMTVQSSVGKDLIRKSPRGSVRMGSLKHPKSPKQPEVIDLSMDSPDRKRTSDEEDSFLVPLSKRLAINRAEWKPSKQQQQTQSTQQKERSFVLSPTVNNSNNNDIDDNCIDVNDNDDGCCLVLEERLASLKRLVSPVLARRSLSPARLDENPQEVQQVESVTNALTQEDSFCPMRSADSAPQESILDISAEIRQKRLSFLARLETSTPKAADKCRPTVPTILGTPAEFPKQRPRLSFSPTQRSQSNQVPSNSTENCQQNTTPVKRLAPSEPICISPEPPIELQKQPVIVHNLSDSDDDLPPLALRVNRRLEAVVLKEMSIQSEPDSFAALVEDIDTPPVVRVNRETSQPRQLPNAAVIPVAAAAAAAAKGGGHKLKVSRKKKVVDDNTGATGSTMKDVDDLQPKKKGSKKAKAVAPVEPPEVPLRLQYVPEGSYPRRVTPTASTVTTMSRCPLAMTFLPGTFEVVLCVDSCEATGGGASKKKEAMITALRSSGVPMDIRKMNVGDFAWVAKRGDKDELVLDCIVERKRTDDLASSIKDGRYREQKHRLMTCGIRRKIYLVEEFNRFASGGISDLALLQAQLNTQVVNDFVIKRTRNVKESAQYLVEVTRALTQRYSQRELKSCLREEIGKLSDDHLMSWHEFNELSFKRRKICTKQVFTRSLIVMKGMSLEKALTVVSAYPTIVSLIEAYEQCDELTQREVLLANLKCPISGRRLGPALSKAVYKFIWGECY